MRAFRFVLPRMRLWVPVVHLAAGLWGAGTLSVGVAQSQDLSSARPAAPGSNTLGSLEASLAPGQERAQAQNAAHAAAEMAQVHGEITDPSGALIPGARIVLRDMRGVAERTVESDKRGQFVLEGLPAGEYTVSASAPGFELFTSTPLTLGPGEVRELNEVTLHLPANHADATVTMTQRDIATAELHAAEQQRILGFPDFYTSFVWNAAPLDTRQKLSLGVHATTDRMAFVTAGLVASGEQLKNTFPEYGGGWEGFGKRYGAAYADGFIGKFLGGAVLPSAFRQDPRYFYMGSNGTTKQRLRHALLSGLLARGDSGRLELNYSHILGNAGAGALSTLYHPAADSAGKLALDNALLGTLGEAGVNVVREFFLKRFVRGGDVDANGMPAPTE